MNAESILMVIFALVACSASLLVPFCKDHVHALLGFLVSSFGVAGLFMSMGLEILSVIAMIFYTIVTIVILLVIYPQRSVEIHENSGWPIIAGGAVSILLAYIFLRGGIFMRVIESRDPVSGILSPEFARYLISHYYFPLGVSVFLLLAVLLGGYLTAGRSGQ